MQTSNITIVALILGFCVGSARCLAVDRTVSAAFEQRDQEAHSYSTTVEKIFKDKKRKAMVDSSIAQAHQDSALKKPAAPCPEGLNTVDLLRGDKDRKQIADNKSDSRETCAVSSDNSAAAKPAIGEAWLEKDGSITMHLMRDADGRFLNATFSYAKENKYYASTLKHIGGLKPGEHKLVLPFDDPPHEK